MGALNLWPSIFAGIYRQRSQGGFGAHFYVFQAFQSWRWTTAKERSNLLRNWFELCNERQEELARLLTAEMGKPLSEARAEIAYGSSFLEWYSEEARRINGEVSLDRP